MSRPEAAESSADSDLEPDAVLRDRDATFTTLVTRRLTDRSPPPPRPPHPLSLIHI